MRSKQYLNLLLILFSLSSLCYSQVLIKEKLRVTAESFKTKLTQGTTNYWPCDRINPFIDGRNYLQYVWTNSRYPLHYGRQNIGNHRIEEDKLYTFRKVQGNQYCYFRREYFNEEENPPEIIENQITVLGRDLLAKDINGNVVNDSIEIIDCDRNPYYASMYHYDYTIYFGEIPTKEEEVVYTVECEGSVIIVHTHIKKASHTIELVSSRDTIMHREENQIILISNRNECPSEELFCFYNGSGIYDDTEFQIEVIEGSEYGELYDAENNYLGNNITLTYREIRNGLYFITEGGENPEEVGKVTIKISTTTEDINPKTLTVEFYIKNNPNKPPGIEIIFEKNVLTPGDSTAIILKERTINGELIDFSPYRFYNIEILQGSQYGELHSYEENRYGDYFFDISGFVSFIAEEEIEEDTVEVEIYVSTGGGIAGELKPVNPKTKERSVTQNNILEGRGKIIIVKRKDCSSAPQCEGEIKQHIDFVKIEENHCSDYPLADGITIFYINRFEEEFNLDACYNNLLDRWQFKIITPLKYSSEVCYREGKIYLRDTSDLRSLPIDEICNAEIDIANFEMAQHVRYKIEEVIRKHEEIHIEQNINMFNQALLEMRFYEKLREYILICEQVNNVNKAILRALKDNKLFLLQLIEKFKENKKKLEGNPNSNDINDIQTWIDNENKINSTPQIQGVVKKYLDTIRKISLCL